MFESRNNGTWTAMGKYMFKVNITDNMLESRNNDTWTPTSKYMFKVNMTNTKKSSIDVVLVSVLLTLNR